MKKTVRHASLALLVLSSSVFTACTPDTPAAKPPESAQSNKGPAQGPVDAKEVEAFADPVFAEKMRKYNVNGSSFVMKQLQPASEIKLTGPTDEWAVKAVTALVSQGIVNPSASVNPDGSVDFRSKQPLLRQEVAVLLDKAFGCYTLPLKVQ
ncbi:hypothetical protein P4H65_08545 [Paenibacillus chitinolyticus]|nr:hypothetical protein [Paenibacillus chitinolyticus]MEC0245844.1 hypothetical protein [Paenibacillus chitinolyticus]